MGNGEGREAQCLRLAAKQLGVIRRDQAVQLGFTGRQVAWRVGTGRWRLVLPSVYRVEGTPETWHQRLMAAYLWGGRRSFLSHDSAAALFGLRRFGPRQLIHLTTLDSPSIAEGVRMHFVGGLEARDVSTAEGFRVTSVTRTLLDLSATESPADVRASVDEALSRRLTSFERLRAFTSRHRGHRGVRALLELLHEYEGGNGPTESELESRVLELLEDEGFPRPLKQQAVKIGGRLRRLDFRFPGSTVVIEADGYAWHCNPVAFERDRERSSALAARGLRVLHWTWAALESRPESLVAELRMALGTRRAA